MAKGVKDGRQILVAQESFSGPLPSPHDLQRYEDTVKGAAERIIAMAEREQQHRHETEAALTASTIRLARVGQILGFVIIILLILAAALSLYLGVPYVAVGIFTVTILCIAHVFVLRQREERRG